MKPIVSSSTFLAVLLATATAHAQHSGVDAALFRPSIDTSGVFSLEGARLMPKRDISWKVLLGYAAKPFEAPVPGIGGLGNEDDDVVLDYLATVDVAFGMSLTSKLAFGFDVALYRTDPGEGYGVRGRYASTGSTPSTGLISTRPLSNLDPSGGFEPQSLSGPLDVRLVAKYMAMTTDTLAVTAMVAGGMPFGEDEMFLGDRSFVLEPRVLLDYRFDQVHATKFVANLGARIRQRSVLEAFDPNAGETMDMAHVVADIGSELFAGVGMNVEVGSAVVLGVEAVGFVPLPSALTFGSCERASGRDCSTIDDEDYFAGAGAGDLAAYANAGLGYRASPHMMIDLMGGAGLLGMRADDFRVLAGVTWSPQPHGAAEIGRGDRDGDGLPDVSDSCMEDAEDRDDFQDDDGCPDVDNDGDGVVDANDGCANEPEDRDAFQDEDGCPERDNDGDGITDVADRCPDNKEDVDGFEDDDGCAEDDNDGDLFPDAQDKCPNEAETVNGIEDDDGCPDVRAQTGPVDAGDRLDLRGALIQFQGSTANLTNASKTILNQVAALVKRNNLEIRVEVHVALGTTSKKAATIRTQQRRDKDLTQRRADAIKAYLVSQGVPQGNLDAVGLGSSRPLGNNADTDPANERVDFIKRRQ